MALVAAAVVLAPVVASASDALANPPANIAPQPNFDASGPCTAGANGTYACANPCVSAQLTFASTYDNAPACARYVLDAIDHADAIDGATPMVLPSNWYALTIPEQLFVVADLERIDRGYPPYLGLNAALDAAARAGAQAGADPSAVTGFAAATWGGTWSDAFSPLAADYGWMYQDGWSAGAGSSSNLDCTSATAPGCWGHRDILLGYDPNLNFDAGLACVTCEMGAGYAVVGGHGSYDDVVARPTGAPPPMTFTWLDEAPFLATGLIVATPPTDPASHPTTTTHPASRAAVQVTTRLLARGAVVRVRWTTSHASAVSAARLVVFANARCAGPLRVVVRRFSDHPTSGQLAVATERRGLGRSLRVLVDDGAGLYWGACVSLGP